MFINECGNRNNPTVILLAPDQGGHGKAGAYISADEEYVEEIEQFIRRPV